MAVVRTVGSGLELAFVQMVSQNLLHSMHFASFRLCKLTNKLFSDLLFASTYRGIPSCLEPCILEIETYSSFVDMNSDKLHGSQVPCPEYLDLTNSYSKRIEYTSDPSETPIYGSMSSLRTLVALTRSDLCDKATAFPHPVYWTS